MGDSPSTPPQAACLVLLLLLLTSAGCCPNCFAAVLARIHNGKCLKHSLKNGSGIAMAFSSARERKPRCILPTSCCCCPLGAGWGGEWKGERCWHYVSLSLLNQLEQAEAGSAVAMSLTLKICPEISIKPKGFRGSTCYLDGHQTRLKGPVPGKTSSFVATWISKQHILRDFALSLD